MSEYLTIDALAIDPLALFFRGDIAYLMELIRHPNLPPVVEIQKALRSTNTEQRNAILEKAKLLETYAKTVEEAVTTMPREAAA